MRPLRWLTLLLVGVGGLAAGAALTSAALALGRSPLMITPWLALVFLVVGGALFAGGREVRRLKSGERSRVTPLQAARIAFFARSAAVNGAGFTGFLLGVLIISAFRLWAPATAAAALGAGIAAAGAAGMTAVAVLVEKWCADESSDPWEGTSPRSEESGRSRDAGAAGAARVAGESIPR